jgi:hypothetical protein
MDDVIVLTWQEFGAGLKDGSIVSGKIEGQPAFWKGDKIVHVSAGEGSPIRGGAKYAAGTERKPIWEVAQEIAAKIPQEEWDKQFQAPAIKYDRATELRHEIQQIVERKGDDLEYLEFIRDFLGSEYEGKPKSGPA